MTKRKELQDRLTEIFSKMERLRTVSDVKEEMKEKGFVFDEGSDRIISFPKK